MIAKNSDEERLHSIVHSIIKITNSKKAILPLQLLCKEALALSIDDIKLMKRHDKVFFFATYKRVTLVKWLLDPLKAPYQTFHSLSLDEIYETLRANFDAYSLSKTNLAKLFGKRRVLKNEFDDLYSIAEKKFIDATREKQPVHLVQPSHISEITNYLRVPRSITQLVAFCDQQKFKLTREILESVILKDPKITIMYDGTFAYIDDCNLETELNSNITKVIMLLKRVCENGENFNKIWSETSEGHLHENEIGFKISVHPDNEHLSVNRLIDFNVPIWFIEALSSNGVKNIEELRTSENIKTACTTMCNRGASKAQIADALKKLRAVEQKNISSLYSELRYLCSGRIWNVLLYRNKGFTLQEVGNKLGVTRERIRQIEKKGIARIQQLISRVNTISKISDNGVINVQWAEMLLSTTGWQIVSYAIRRAKSKNVRYVEQIDSYIVGSLDINDAIEHLEEYIHQLNNPIDIKSVMPELLAKMSIHGPVWNEKRILAYLKNKNYKVHGNNLSQGLRLNDAARYIVEKYFPDGIHVYSDQSLNVLRIILEKEFKFKPEISNRGLAANVSRGFVLRGKGIYISSKFIPKYSPVLDEIYQFVESSNCEVLYSSLYQKFTHTLKRLGIDNQHYLHGVLMYYFSDRLVFKKGSVRPKHVIDSKAYNLSDEQTVSLNTEINDDVKDAVVSVLEEHFTNGIRPNSIIDWNKLRNFYREATGEEIPSEIEISSLLNAIGTYHGDKVFLIPSNGKNSLMELLNSLISEGNRVLYYSEFYDIHADCLQEIHIFSAELLRTVLTSLLPSLCYSRVYFSVTNSESPESEVLRCYKTAICLSYQQLKEQLPYLPLDKIKQVLAQNNDFIWVHTGVYTHVSKLEIDEVELRAVERRMEAEITERGYISLACIGVKNNLELNPELSEIAVKNGLFQIYFANRYEKRGNIINPKGSALNAVAVFEDFCLTHHRLSLDNLFGFEKEISGRVHSKSLFVAYETMVRVDQDTFVGDSEINFDVDATDNALALFFDTDVIPLQAVTSFTSFPYIDGYPWNWYLLESFCTRFSKLFMYQCLSVNSKNVGAIFRRSAGFLDYIDVLTSAVVASNIELNIKSVGDYLFENRYVAKRTVAVSKVVKRARVLKGRGV